MARGVCIQQKVPCGKKPRGESAVIENTLSNKGIKSSYSDSCVITVAENWRGKLQ